MLVSLSKGVLAWLTAAWHEREQPNCEKYRSRWCFLQQVLVPHREARSSKIGGSQYIIVYKFVFFDRRIWGHKSCSWIDSQLIRPWCTVLAVMPMLHWTYGQSREGSTAQNPRGRSMSHKAGHILVPQILDRRKMYLESGTKIDWLNLRSSSLTWVCLGMSSPKAQEFPTKMIYLEEM